MKSSFVKFFCVALLFTISCKKYNKESKPNNVLTEKQMVSILVDLHLSDAMMQLKNTQPKSYIYLNSSKMYNSILRHNNTSPATFDSSLHYYSSRPIEMKKIYTKVIEEISLKNR